MKKKLHLLALVICFGTSSYVSAQIADGGFEGGPRGGSWTEASTNFGTPICNTADCGDCGGNCGPNSGTYYAWFGGANFPETGSVEQSVTFSKGTIANLNMMVKIANTGAKNANDKFVISIDQNTVHTMTVLDSASYVRYKLLSVDVSSYADGNAHTVRLEGFQSTSARANILVDDVELIITGDTVGLFEPASEADIKLYPNPANDAVNIEFGELNGSAQISIHSIDGAVISQEVLNNVFHKKFTFNSSNMNNGVYFIKIENNGNVSTKRFVIAK